jgi:hypothetical protein
VRHEFLDGVDPVLGLVLVGVVVLLVGLDVALEVADERGQLAGEGVDTRSRPSTSE